MNEKYVEALEQYDMEVRAVRKGRGSWICETDQGCRLLKEYRGTARRLEFEDEVLGRLDTKGSLRADRYLRNREGGLMTVTGDGTRYIRTRKRCGSRRKNGIVWKIPTKPLFPKKCSKKFRS